LVFALTLPVLLRYDHRHPIHHLQPTDAVQIGQVTVKAVKDMVLAPDGFVHVAEDGITRSYAGELSLLQHDFITVKVD
jgi:hypothetical protein